MGQHHRAEVLVLKGHPPAASDHARHLLDHGRGVGHVEHDGDGQGRVETPAPEGQALAVGNAQRHAGAQRMLAGEQARRLHRGSAAVDTDDAAPGTHHGDEVADDHARPAADLQDRVARLHGDEAEEPAAQPLLGSRAPAPLQGLDEAQRIGLGVDVAERIGMRAHRAGRLGAGRDTATSAPVNA